MPDITWDQLTAYRSRIRGCLLGGAIGDALGRPVERAGLAQIRATYGPQGLTDLMPDEDGATGRISDDTQLTLFTAEGWMTAYDRIREKGISGAEVLIVHDAYLRWLETQDHTAPPPRSPALRHHIGRLRDEQWLYARRGAGRSCLDGLRQGHTPEARAPITGLPGPVNPGSKGGGALARSVPFGFTDTDPRLCFELAARCAQTSHGHPTAYLSAGALAATVRHLLLGSSLADAVGRSLELLGHYPGHEETGAALRRALALAANGPATPDTVDSFGSGWTAEEILGVAVYAALAQSRSWPVHTRFESGLLLAVNHSGTSDSSGAVCGSLLGAHYGDVMLSRAWLARLEGRATIATLADDFAALVHPGDRRRWWLAEPPTP
ncbi:ADP-ribosylglycohydrolase family protein [Kitasatospora sp. NPDC054939]